MGFKTGDIVVDCYGKRGIVISNADYRFDDVLLLIRTGKDSYSTLQTLKKYWKIVGHFDEFEDILNIL